METPPIPAASSLHITNTNQALEDRLNQALKSNKEFAAVLDTPPLKNAFLLAAQQDSAFANSAFEAAEGSSVTSQQFRAQFLKNQTFQSSLAECSEPEWAEQKQASQTPELWQSAQYRSTVNQDQRPEGETISHVILGHTVGANAKSSIDWVAKAPSPKSFHYVIGLDGTLYCLVPEKYRAWYAASANWEGCGNMRDRSIGIWLDHCGFSAIKEGDPCVFPEAQMNTLLALLKDIQQRHAIPAQNFVAHAEVSPSVKVGPNHYFPWSQLAERGFGLALEPSERPNALPEDFDVNAALKKLGYHLSNPDKAMRAFNQRHRRLEDTHELSQEGKLELYGLVLKKERLISQAATVPLEQASVINLA